MSLAFIVGVAVVIVVLVVISQLIDREKHGALRHFFMAITIPLLLLIPANLMMDKDCSYYHTGTDTFFVYGVNYTDYHFDSYNKTLGKTLVELNLFHTNTTNYYMELCSETPHSAKVFMRVLLTINFLYAFYLIIKYFSDVLNWLKGIGRKI